MDARGGPSDSGGDGRPSSDRGSQRSIAGRAAGRFSADDQVRMAVPRSGEMAGLGADTGEPGELEVPGSYRDYSDMAAPAGAADHCEFLRSIASDGSLRDAGHEAVATHRCAAFGDPLPLSLRQQELVCLQRVHVSCPRYMRGQLLAEELAATVVPRRKKGGSSLFAVGLAFVLVAGLAAGAFAFGLVPGIGLGPGPVATGSKGPTASASVLVPTPTELDTPEPTPSPTRAPTATPAQTPVSSPTWPPGATASRMKLLTPCADQPDCYVYVVRDAGENGSKVADTVPGIATFFGVSQDKIYEMNPWAEAGITPGDKLKIPPPTR